MQKSTDTQMDTHFFQKKCVFSETATESSSHVQNQLSGLVLWTGLKSGSGVLFLCIPHQKETQIMYLLQQQMQNQASPTMTTIKIKTDTVT